MFRVGCLRGDGTDRTARSLCLPSRTAWTDERLNSKPEVQLSVIKVSRFLVISWLAGPFGWFSQPPGVQAYKLAETPINITDSTNATVVREATVVQSCF